MRGDVVLRTRVEGVVKLFKRPSVVIDAPAHVIFLFQHRRMRLKSQSKRFLFRRVCSHQCQCVAWKGASARISL